MADSKITGCDCQVACKIAFLSSLSDVNIFSDIKPQRKYIVEVTIPCEQTETIHYVLVSGLASVALKVCIPSGQ